LPRGGRSASARALTQQLTISIPSLPFPACPRFLASHLNFSQPLAQLASYLKSSNLNIKIDALNAAAASRLGEGRRMTGRAPLGDLRGVQTYNRGNRSMRRVTA
jgi:hypothetical protein